MAAYEAAIRSLCMNKGLATARFILFDFKMSASKVYYVECKKAPEYRGNYYLKGNVFANKNDAEKFALGIAKPDVHYYFIITRTFKIVY
jgi:hypothetical protein